MPRTPDDAMRILIDTGLTERMMNQDADDMHASVAARSVQDRGRDRREVERRQHGPEDMLPGPVRRKAIDDRRRVPPAVEEYLDIQRRIALARNEAIEECARLIETNALISGSIGPLMDAGWNMANKVGAEAIRALKVKP
jgi:hypothetical protein